jgi:hypothetical protein
MHRCLRALLLVDMCGSHVKLGKRRTPHTRDSADAPNIELESQLIISPKVIDGNVSNIARY